MSQITPHYIGKLRVVDDVSAEYLSLARADERVGRLLLQQGHARHAVYYFVQAMEKTVRSTIFRFVNPHTEYFRNRTRTHRLDELLDFMVEIVCSKSSDQEQLKDILQYHVLGGVRFGKLHNDLRYPFFSNNSGSYRSLDVSVADGEIALEKLEKLQTFLKDIDRFRRI